MRGYLGGEVVAGEVEELEVEALGEGGEGVVEAVAAEVEEAELVEGGEGGDGAAEVEEGEGHGGDAAVGACYAEPIGSAWGGCGGPV